MENKQYIRICKCCNTQIQYKSYSAWYLANKNESLCRSCSAKLKINRVGDLSVLLEDSLETYYWIGFLLADGSFTNNRLELTLSNNDADHLYKFAKYIKYTGSYGKRMDQKQIYCKNIDTVSAICKKFQIHNNKTYNPPETLLKFSESQNLALIAGFIDGDGHIAKHRTCNSFRLTIKLHSSWLQILREINRFLCNTDYCKINTLGYAELTISDSEILKELKQKVIQLNIPIMLRKWNIIDTDYVSKYTKAKLLKNNVISLYNSGMPRKEISKKLNTSLSNITKILKKYYVEN